MLIRFKQLTLHVERPPGGWNCILDFGGPHVQIDGTHARALAELCELGCRYALYELAPRHRDLEASGAVQAPDADPPSSASVLIEFSEVPLTAELCPGNPIGNRERSERSATAQHLLLTSLGRRAFLLVPEMRLLGRLLTIAADLGLKPAGWGNAGWQP